MNSSSLTSQGPHDSIKLMVCQTMSFVKSKKLNVKGEQLSVISCPLSVALNPLVRRSFSEDGLILPAP